MNDTLAGLLQVLALVVLLAVAYVPARRLHGPRLHRPRSTGASRRSSTASCGSTPRPANAGPPTPRVCSASPSSRIVLLYLLQRLQPLLPLSFGRDAVPPGMAFNNAVSFTTNTNWQSYVPASRSSATPVQMAGFTVQNVMSAAVGLAVAVALIRGILARPDRAPRQLLGRPHPRRRPHPAAARRSSRRSCWWRAVS